MNDQTANRIVFLILLIVIVLLLFTANIALNGKRLLNGIKNNTGNFSGTKILLAFISIIAILGLISWLLQSKKSDRKSLSRSKEKAE